MSQGGTEESRDPDPGPALAAWPAPEVIAGYEAIEPGLGGRLFAMLERQAAHRRRVEAHEAARGLRQRACALGAFAGLALAALAGGFLLAALR